MNACFHFIYYTPIPFFRNPFRFECISFSIQVAMKEPVHYIILFDYTILTCW